MARKKPAPAAPEPEEPTDVQPESEAEAEESEPEEEPRRLTQPSPAKYPDRFVGKVGKKSITFIVARQRPALIWDMITRQAVNAVFVRACAIGLYWFGDKPQSAKLPYSNAVTWGEAVANELLLRGWSFDDIFELGGELLDAAAATLPTEAETEEEADFLG